MSADHVVASERVPSLGGYAIRVKHDHREPGLVITVGTRNSFTRVKLSDLRRFQADLAALVDELESKESIDAALAAERER
jgi:hypothetical protein